MAYTAIGRQTAAASKATGDNLVGSSMSIWESNLRGLVRRQLPVAVAVAGVSVLVACASAAPSATSARPASTPSQPPLGTVPTSGYAQAAATLPLSAYALPGADRAAIINAGEMLVQRCMKAKGFTYPVTLVSSLYALALNEPYGITDMSQAAKYGYGDSAEDPVGSGGGLGAAGPISALPNLQKKYGEAYVRALFGNVASNSASSNNSGGCVDASNQLYATRPAVGRDLQLLDELTQQGEQFAGADSRVLQKEKAWSSCMRAKGFSYGNPVEAQNAAWPPAPDAAELVTAVTDVQCKENTNLPGMWLAVEAGYQRQLISMNESQLAELRAEQQALIKRALSMVRGG